MDLQTLRAHAGEGLPFTLRLDSVNKGIGLVALGLPLALLLISALGAACPGIDSISHHYYTRIGGDILVGALTFIGLQMAFFYQLPIPGQGRGPMVDGYLGYGKWDIRAARFAGLCAFGVALVPTSGPGCEDYGGRVTRLFLEGTTGGHAVPGENGVIDGRPTFDFWGTFGIHDGILSGAHYGAAAGMFAVLAYYALVVFTRPQSAAAFTPSGELQLEKRRRNQLYRVFGGLIVIAMGALAAKSALPLVVEDSAEALARWNHANLTFWFEALGLMAFGCAWCLKGGLFGLFRHKTAVIHPDVTGRAA